MAWLLDMLLYATYAVFNTAAMAAIKTALPRLRAGRTARTLFVLACGVVTYGIALAAMLLLLRRHDASIVIPIAIGCVILVTHAAGRRFYGEPLTAPKIAGACLVVAGVALLSTAGAAP
jgi:multidrug transporter EmrE-like cation transporter